MVAKTGRDVVAHCVPGACHITVYGIHCDVAAVLVVTNAPASISSEPLGVSSVLVPLLLTFSGSMPAAMYVAAMLRVAVLSSTGSWGAVMACRSTTQ